MGLTVPAGEAEHGSALRAAETHPLALGLLHRTLTPTDPAVAPREPPALTPDAVPLPLWRRLRGRVAAGVLMAAAGIVVTMGIITAEAVYPATYTTHDNEVSDLGATRPPDSIIRQPSARIFNGTMLVAGVLIIAAGEGLRASAAPRRAWVPVALLGIGVLGVGIFPGNRAPMHGMFAMLAFVSGGIGGVLMARVTHSPFRWMSLLLGGTALGALGVAMLADITPLWDELGDGGVERWVVYPVALWLVLAGGYLASGTTSPFLPQRATRR